MIQFFSKAMSVNVMALQFTTKYIFLLIFFVSFTTLFAQEDKSKVLIIGRAQENSILLRLAPGSPALWELGNKYGYVIERFTVTRGKEYLGNKERKVLTSPALKPWPLQQWEPLADSNTFAEVGAEAIYGEKFELSTDFEQDVIQIYNKAKELESRYSFALFAADVSIDVAKASGLFLEDKNVKKGERYLYRVYSAVPQDLVKSETGFVYINLDDYAPLPEIKEIKATFSDRSVMISWDTRDLQSSYTAYWIERSEDGKNFKRITEVPYVNLRPENVSDPGVFYKLDSLEQNNKTYYYRVIGITPFGEVSKPSDVAQGEGFEALKSAPAIRKLSVINKQMSIQWEYPKEDESAIKGFEIERSRKTDTGFKSISPLLPAGTREFIDLRPESTNYYRIAAIGRNGEKSFSFSTLQQLEDSIPPLAPTGLIASIDTTGTVSLRWNNNTESDLEGYRVFRSNFQSSEFSQVTSTPVDTSLFSEKISLKNLTKEVYYKVQAIDNRFNPSAYSAVLKLVKPDVVPPVPPVISDLKTEQDKILLRWTPSASKDVQYHRTWIVNEGEGSTWRSPQTFYATDRPEYQYKNLPPGRYGLKIEAADSAGNVTNSKIVRANVTGAAPKAIEEISAVPDRVAKTVTLRWKYEQKDIEKFLVYRAEGSGRVTLYKSLTGASNQFIDSNVTVNSAYTYYVKAVFKRGVESGYSKKVEVVF